MIKGRKFQKILRERHPKPLPYEEGAITPRHKVDISGAAVVIPAFKCATPFPDIDLRSAILSDTLKQQ